MSSWPSGPDTMLPKKVGCEVVPGGVLDTQARIFKIKEERATAMMGAPTYILGMAETAKNRLQLPSWQSCGKDYK